jgi:hypothetical protein
MRWRAVSPTVRIISTKIALLGELGNGKLQHSRFEQRARSGPKSSIEEYGFLASCGIPSSQFQDTTQAVLDRAQIQRRKLPFVPREAPLVDRPHLIAHCNRIWSGRGDGNKDGRARLRAGRKGYDHHRPPRPVEPIGVDHNGRSRFSNFAALGGMEIDPPDLASAHRCGTNRLTPKLSSGAVSARFRRETVVDGCRFPLGHLGRQRLILLHGERRPIEGIAVADLVRRKSLLQQSLHKFAPLPGRDGSLEPPNQIFREAQQELLCGHAQLAKLLTAININIDIARAA